MGEGPQRSSSSKGIPLRHLSVILLTIQYTAFALLLHYSRVMPTVTGKRYLTSTAVFLNEVIKLSISLTIALYEVSKSAPPSVPATSLFFTLSSAVFSGDSWKLAIPALLYTLANSLQYIALSNLEVATFQVTYQLKILSTALFGLALLGTSIPSRKWAVLLFLVAGVALTQLPNGDVKELSHMEDTHLYFPRSLEEWKRMGGTAAHLYKRSATYEGIQEDELSQLPRLDATIGLLATIGASISSGLAGTYLLKVLKDSSNQTSLWVRNVQLASYSIFPSLFIGVVFLDGEKVATNGFFEGYNWTVWATIIVQALGGVFTAFCIANTDKIARNTAASISIVLSTLASVWFFNFQVTGTFVVGAIIVLIATYLYGNPTPGPSKHGLRPPPIRIDSYEKDIVGEIETAESSPRNDFSIKLPTTPLLNHTGMSTSRPTSPNPRTTSGSYFGKQQRDS